jgi:hypothetical protein
MTDINAIITWVSFLIIIPALWLLLFLYFVGQGFILFKLFGYQVSYRSIFKSMWLGIVLNVMIAQIYQIFAQIDLPIIIVLGVLSLLGWLLNKKAIVDFDSYLRKVSLKKY